MAIKTIELICLPCPKCAPLEEKIRNLIKAIESVNRIKIPYEFKHITNLRDVSKYSINPAQTPAIVINGTVEFAGRIDIILLGQRLESIHRAG